LNSQLLRQSRIIPVVVLAMLAVSVLLSCTLPSPLYGTWADNKGNTIAFFADNTFNTKMIGSLGTKSYEGNYTVLLNSLTMDCSEIGLRIVTEWDIRGNILYIDWITVDEDTLTLSLFKTSN
jgi:hypothetical protein